jgi:hypothetical protein
MRSEDVKRALEIAIGYQDHDAFAAAARIGWPDALLELQDVIHELDDANSTLLRQMKQLVKADELVRAWLAYVKRFVKAGPYDTDKEFTTLVQAVEEYQELRGK